MFPKKVRLFEVARVANLLDAFKEDNMRANQFLEKSSPDNKPPTYLATAEDFSHIYPLDCGNRSKEKLQLQTKAESTSNKG